MPSWSTSSKPGASWKTPWAFKPVLRHLQGLIWGRQFRLIASRGRIRRPGSQSRLNQGGRADPRRYARYRCGPKGEFRCLLVTCLIALCDTTAGDGAFCLIPGSHKCQLAHPYSDRDLEEVPPLEDLPPDGRLGGRLYRERLPRLQGAPPPQPILARVPVRPLPTWRTGRGVNLRPICCGARRQTRSSPTCCWPPTIIPPGPRRRWADRPYGSCANFSVR